MPDLAAAAIAAAAECAAGICFLLLAAYMLGRWRADSRRGPAVRVMSAERIDGSEW